MSVAQWYEGCGLSRRVMSIFRREQADDPCQVVGKSPRYWFDRGLLHDDLFAVLKVFRTVLLEYVGSKKEVTSYLRRYHWNDGQIHSLQVRGSEREERSVNVEAGVETRFIEHASGRRHKHGESRKNFLKR